MAEMLDWQRIDDPHAIIHYAVQLLRQGRTVAFPSETGYAVTASGLVPEAVRRLPVDRPSGNSEAQVVPELMLVVRGAGEARDWAPAMSPLSQRLARRLWPGPVTLIVGGGIERGLASRLPEEVRGPLCVSGRLRLATPQHEALREVLHHLPGPLVMTPPASGGSNAPGVTADLIIADESAAPAQPATVIVVNGEGWEIVQPGAVPAEQVHQQMACWIVFVCTGNTCRSPLAEALCKKILADRLGCAVEELPARGYHVVSAGVSALEGGPAAAEAEQVARGFGADLSAHRSQPLTMELAARADYLLGMTRSHARALMDYFGHLGVVPRLLDPAGDIADPIGGDQQVYDECGQQIWRHLETFVGEIAPTSPQRQQEGAEQP
ncbi:MAG TPA: Sua5/YciO/YrdC/YwlC family protein [Gemmataceae bacterium]|nr:Sua5/YciO/YrdC/YwlC family protein [Gemmataceae bacterium]